MAKNITTFVIAYDFDGTLSEGNMQEYNFIPELGIDNPQQFWQRTRELAQKHHADPILSYMYLMLREAKRAEVPIRREQFIKFGAGIKLFPGLTTWFDRINTYATAHHIEVKHFIISSGLREMIAGTPIAGYFSKIYASGFMYDENGVATWPALAINYTAKTQYLFRINKGSLEEFDDSKINAYLPEKERPVPFKHMLFIGDGQTDVPAMRTVKSQGGYAIATYAANNQTARISAEKLIREERATIIAPANYNKNSVMEKAVKAIINTIAEEQQLINLNQ